MKRIIVLFLFIFSLGVHAQAQVTTKEVVKVTTDITGASCADGKLYYQGTTGKNWERVNGVCTRVDGVGAVLAETDPIVRAINGIVKSNGTTIAAAGASDLPSAIDAAKIADGTVSSAEFQFINSVTSNVQTQIDSKAPLNSPALTGTPTVPSATVDTNTTQAASTAFVLAQAASANPLMDGSVAVGTSTRYARGDHVHPIDTSRAPLVSPTFTGTPAAPSIALTGTGGLGFLEGLNQSSAPATPTSAGRLFWDASNRFSWKGTNGFVRTFDGTANSADRVYVLQNRNGTIADDTDLAGKQATGNYITALTGDGTASGPGSVALTLKNTGTAGTYRSATFDAQGRETSGTNPTTFSGYGLSDTSANLRAALTDELGTGADLFDGATPTSFILTNATGLPTTGLTGALQAAQEPAHTGDVTNSPGSLSLSIANNAVTLAKLATQATNTVLGNATSGTAVPTALAVGTCSTAGSALIWTTNTGFGCNTSITAASVSGFTAGAGTLTGPASAGVAETLGNNETITGIKTYSPTARSSGVAAYYTLNVPADTGQSASTESIGVNFVTATRTWVDGTVALQRERFFAGVTYNKTTTSATFTDIFNTAFTQPIAGSGVTFTRPHTIGILDSTAATSSITGGLIVATTYGTSATSVGIGGGNINAGGTITAGTPIGVASGGWGLATLTSNAIYKGNAASAPVVSSLTDDGTIFKSTDTSINFSSSTMVGVNAAQTSMMLGGNATAQGVSAQGTGGFLLLSHNAFYDNIVYKSISTEASENIVLSGGTINLRVAPSVSAGTQITWSTGILINAGATVSMPNLGTSSAATTGTVCWTTGTGLLNVDTTTTCLLSSGKFKQQERPLVGGLDTVLRLRPVSYFLKPEFNPTGLGEQIGFFAEDVAKVDSRLVSLEADGSPHAVRYQQLTAHLTLAIQQLNAKVEAQQKEIEQLKGKQ